MATVSKGTGRVTDSPEILSAARCIWRAYHVVTILPVLGSPEVVSPPPPRLLRLLGRPLSCKSVGHQLDAGHVTVDGTVVGGGGMAGTVTGGAVGGGNATVGCEHGGGDGGDVGDQVPDRVDRRRPWRRL